MPIVCAPRIFAASDVPVFQAPDSRAGFDIAWHQKQEDRMMSMMYQAYQNHMDLTAPWRTGAASALKYLNLVPQGVSDKLFGRLAAALELISRTSLTYARPAYGIDRVMVGNQELEVTEEVAFATPFGSLLHFKKENSPEQPRMLLVAPMSGHFATLLRGTVKTLLQDHDVYITDWHNPRDIPLDQGKFGLDEYTEHLITFLERARPALAHGGDLPALGVGAGRRRHHVGGQSSGAAGDADLDGRADRYPDSAHQGQRFRQEQAADMVRGQPDQLRAVSVQGRVPAGLSRLRPAHRLCVDESRAPHQAACRPRRSSRQGRDREGRNHQDLL